MRSVPGGCINHGAAVETDTGATLFLKWNSGADPDLFHAEVDGLDALRAAAALRVPEALAWSPAGSAGPAWLLLEYLPHDIAGAATERRLGEGLARLHSMDMGSSFGWHRDNYIGSLPQPNPRAPAWGEFWRDHRLTPQIERAREGGWLSEPSLDRILELTPGALVSVTGPSLVHGDLWSGNTFATRVGEPVLVDPASYLADSEVDLAMTELFGGFGAAFYDAYASVRALSDEYGSYRRDLYQLYYLLAHLNLFGASYEGACRAVVQRILGELA